MLCRALFCMFLRRWAGRKGPPGSYGAHRSRIPPGMKRTCAGNHYPWRRENPCTEVQVFHSEYRENEAKIMAKVAQRLKSVFSAGWDVLRWKRPVLGKTFGLKNVSCVPSLLGSAECQMGQVRRAGLDLSTRAAHPKFGVSG